MRFLLDTHVALWAIGDSPRLSAKARALLGDEESEIFVSAASIWEIAIKHPLKRASAGDFTISAEQASTHFESAGFEFLPVTALHARLVETLPLLHADPFDRLIFAQALAEPLRLLTHDKALQAYSDTVIAV